MKRNKGVAFLLAMAIPAIAYFSYLCGGFGYEKLVALFLYTMVALLTAILLFRPNQ